MTHRLPAVVLGALLGIALIPQQSLAHAAYKDSDPKDGETVSSPPSRVTAEFTEQVVQDSYLQVFDPCGRQVDNRDSLVVHDRITVSMSGEAQGVYVVRFNVVSAVDGHQTVGSFDFTSSGGSECPGQEEPEGEKESGPSSGGGGGGGDSGSTSSGAGSEDAASTTSRGRARDRDQGPEVRGTRTEARDKPRSHRDDGAATGREATTDALAAANDAADEREESIWAGIPMGWFAVALVMAAIVGAAGGFVYAGIVGPRRV